MSASPPFDLRQVDAEAAAGLVPKLAGILMDCVEGGASVTFMAPLDRGKAEDFWRGVAAGVAAGDRLLFVAEDSTGPVGTVQLVFAPQENQPHRAEIAKLLVHRRGRGRGVGEALMRAAEGAARQAGRSLLVLDTEAGGTADRLYRRLGWTDFGTVPHFALMPDGGPCHATFFYKAL